MKSNVLKLEDISVQDLLSDRSYEELDEENSEESPENEDPEEGPESTQATEVPEVKTPAEAPTSGDDDSIISQLSQSLGYELDGEFDESIEGISNFTKKAAQHIANEKLGEVFTRFPIAYDLIQHLNKGGKPETFVLLEREPSYVEGDLEKASDDTLKAIIADSLKKQGYDEEDIAGSLEDYEDTGLLKKQGRLAQGYLKKYFTKERERKEKDAADAEIEEQRKADYAITEIKTTISSGVLAADFTIPTKDQSQFESWMFATKSNGKTQRDIERESMTIQEKLALEYLFFKKFKLSDIVHKKAASLNAEKLREKLKALPKTKNLTGAAKPSRGTASEIPSFTDIFSD